MKRTEIIDEAKAMVLNYGPTNVLEFGGEIFDSHTPSDSVRRKYREEILTEARNQARRVYRFLGWDPA